jgi:uncharacterized protein (DUF1684 family)
MSDAGSHEHDHDHDHDHHEHEHGGHEHEPLTEADYIAAVEAYRADKDAFFRESPNSPIPVDQREAFTGLPYYPVDPALSLEDLQLRPYTGSEPETFQIPTSDGQLRPAHRAGTFSFEHDGRTMTLTGYTLDGGHSHSIFVPFLDATSGTETYGAGRYLDLEPEEDGTYWLDFNLAYHPSCVYDPQYSCPLTPAENRLPVRIEAGERLPSAEAGSNEVAAGR